jgi:glutamyl-tRNA synthetase
MREKAEANGESPKYNGKWRNRNASEAPPGVKPVIRLKSPTEGSTSVHDIVQGTVTVSNDQLDDMILVRSDGTPTFMLSVVIDDHDMGITHVIRGDDHLTNTFRHIQIFNAFGWDIPKFGHIPLIHGSDGAKLSKRHGALGIDAYRDMGYLPEAICNCLLRLGWSHGDDEIISKEQAVNWFNTENLGKSASRLDFLKLDNLNKHYMHISDNDRLLQNLSGIIGDISEEKMQRLRKGMNGLKQRAKTLLDLRDLASVYINDPAATILTGEEKNILNAVLHRLECIEDWTEMNIENELRTFAEASGFSFGKVAQILRNVLTGRKITPSIFEMLFSFGKQESLNRIISSLFAQN